MTRVSGKRTNDLNSKVEPEDLVSRICAGSMNALAELYELHASHVYRIALRLTGSEAEAADVVQDVFVALPRSLKTFRGSGSLEGWLKRVAVRTALMRNRARDRRSEVTLDPTARLDQSDSAPEIVVRLALERALLDLPETERTVFVLKVIEGYSHEEVASLLDITPEASRARLARARRVLRNALSD